MITMRDIFYDCFFFFKKGVWNSVENFFQFRLVFWMILWWSCLVSCYFKKEEIISGKLYFYCFSSSFHVLVKIINMIYLIVKFWQFLMICLCTWIFYILNSSHHFLLNSFVSFISFKILIFTQPVDHRKIANWEDICDFEKALNFSSN